MRKRKMVHHSIELKYILVVASLIMMLLFYHFFVGVNENIEPAKDMKRSAVALPQLPLPVPPDSLPEFPRFPAGGDSANVLAEYLKTPFAFLCSQRKRRDEESVHSQPSASASFECRHDSLRLSFCELDVSLDCAVAPWLKPANLCDGSPATLEQLSRCMFSDSIHDLFRRGEAPRHPKTGARCRQVRFRFVSSSPSSSSSSSSSFLSTSQQQQQQPQSTSEDAAAVREKTGLRIALVRSVTDTRQLLRYVHGLLSLSLYAASKPRRNYDVILYLGESSHYDLEKTTGHFSKVPATLTTLFGLRYEFALYGDLDSVIIPSNLHVPLTTFLFPPSAKQMAPFSHKCFNATVLARDGGSLFGSGGSAVKNPDLEKQMPRLEELLPQFTSSDDDDAFSRRDRAREMDLLHLVDSPTAPVMLMLDPVFGHFCSCFLPLLRSSNTLLFSLLMFDIGARTSCCATPAFDQNAFIEVIARATELDELQLQILSELMNNNGHHLPDSAAKEAQSAAQKRFFEVLRRRPESEYDAKYKTLDWRRAEVTERKVFERIVSNSLAKRTPQLVRAFQPILRLQFLGPQPPAWVFENSAEEGELDAPVSETIWGSTAFQCTTDVTRPRMLGVFPPMLQSAPWTKIATSEPIEPWRRGNCKMVNRRRFWLGKFAPVGRGYGDYGNANGCASRGSLFFHLGKPWKRVIPPAGDSTANDFLWWQGQYFFRKMTRREVIEMQLCE